MYNFTKIDVNRINKFIADNNIQYKEEGHSYFYGNSHLKSVSEILREKGISSDYSKVDEKTLERARMRGTAIHLQVEEALRYGDLNDCEDEALEIINYINTEAKKGCVLLEQQVCNLNEFLPYGGRFDILIENKENKVILFDIKTYKSWSSDKRMQVKWQLSFYAYALESMGAGKVDELAVLRFNENKLVCEKLNLVDKEEFLQLLKNEKLEIATYPLNEIDANNFIEMLKKEEELKELEEKTKEIKEKICEYMEKQDIIKVIDENKTLMITLVKGGTTTSFDSSKFKKEEPSLYEKYTKKSNRKSYLKIKRLENV